MMVLEDGQAVAQREREDEHEWETSVRLEDGESWRRTGVETPQLDAVTLKMMSTKHSIQQDQTCALA
jgi:hypothetical protein